MGRSSSPKTAVGPPIDPVNSAIRSEVAPLKILHMSAPQFPLTSGNRGSLANETLAATFGALQGVVTSHFPYPFGAKMYRDQNVVPIDGRFYMKPEGPCRRIWETAHRRTRGATTWADCPVLC